LRSILVYLTISSGKGSLDSEKSSLEHREMEHSEIEHRDREHRETTWIIDVN
jgi:hypothetical protein